nr:RNA 2',3'-cyclic phosphodiesterase [Anaerolineae bacterium]
MAGTWRLFIAIEIPRDVLETIADVQTLLKRRHPEFKAVRWVKPEGIHLTLKFLGDVETEAVDRISGAIQDCASQVTPFAMGIEGFGCFPHTRRPRVIWLGITGDLEQLKTLQASIEQATTQLGFEPENRDFSPHLTLGRIKHPVTSNDLEDICEFLDTTEVEQLAEWRVSSVSLIRSQLKPDGAIYTRISEASLPGDGPTQG